MLYSISNTTQKNKDPLMRSEIKAYGSVGKPFCVQLDTEPQAWYLVPDGCDNGISLPLEYLGSDGDKYFYNGDIDLISYLEGEGYSVPIGRYKFKIVSGAGEITVDSLVSTSFNSIAKVDYNNQYGIFELDVDFVNRTYFYFELITSGYTDYLSFYIDGNSIEVTTKNSSVLMDAVNYTMTETGNYKVTVKRNSEVDEYITGGIGQTQILIDDVIIFDDATGNTSFNYSLSDDLSFLQWQSGDGIGIRSINDFLPDDFTITSNTFEIQQKSTGEITVTGGINKYTDLFILDSSEPVTYGVGEFSNDYSNDYAI